LTEWCQANIPPGEPVLIHDAGYLAYMTDIRMIDMVGLKSPEVVRLHETLTAPSRGFRRVEVFEILARTHNAHYMIVRDIWEAPFGFATEMRKRGWDVAPMRKGPYTVYRLTPPEARTDVQGR
jgi:hypothetical protein